MSKLFRKLHKHVYILGFFAVVLIVALITGSVEGAIAGYIMGVKLSLRWL